MTLFRRMFGRSVQVNGDFGAGEVPLRPNANELEVIFVGLSECGRVDAEFHLRSNYLLMAVLFEDKEGFHLKLSDPKIVLPSEFVDSIKKELGMYTNRLSEAVPGGVQTVGQHSLWLLEKSDNAES